MNRNLSADQFPPPVPRKPPTQPLKPQSHSHVESSSVPGYAGSEIHFQTPAQAQVYRQKMAEAPGA